VTDFDCWHPDHNAVTVAEIIRVLNANAEKARQLVARLARDFPKQHEPCPIGSDRALDSALISAPEARRTPNCLKKLDAGGGAGYCGYEGRRQNLSQHLGRRRRLDHRRDRPAAIAARVRHREACGLRCGGGGNPFHAGTRCSL